MPPHSRSPEAPDEELATLSTQHGEPGSAQVDGDNARSNLDNPVHPNAVTEAGDERLRKSVGGNAAKREHVQSDPVHALRAVSEHRAVAQLMGDGNGDCQVTQQVDEVPPLIAEHASHRDQ